MAAMVDVGGDGGDDNDKDDDDGRDGDDGDVGDVDGDVDDDGDDDGDGEWAHPEVTANKHQDTKSSSHLITGQGRPVHQMGSVNKLKMSDNA